jgi:predicted nucleotidyltransferase
MSGMIARDLEKIAHRHGVELILKFGSMVTGRVHPRSDVDLAVLLDRPAPSFEELADLRHELQSLNSDREVDVAIINHADPLFLKKITEGCRLLYGSPRRLAELKIYAFKRYQDHRRYLALEREYVQRTLARLSSS